WWCGSDGGKVKGGRYHEEVIVSRAVGEVAGPVAVRLVAVGVDDEDRRPRDPAPLARIPQPDRSEDPFATRVTVDRERQPPSSRQGGVPPGRVDRDGDDLTAEAMDLLLLRRQPDQLATAIRSPVSAVRHEDQRAGRSAQLEQPTQGTATSGHRRTVSPDCLTGASSGDCGNAGQRELDLSVVNGRDRDGAVVGVDDRLGDGEPEP